MTAAERKSAERKSTFPQPNRWSEERVAVLTRLWNEGKSASKIAAIIGGGITKNAVIGKVHRIHLPSHGPNMPKGNKRRPKAAGIRRRQVLKINKARNDTLSVDQAMEAALGPPKPFAVNDDGVDVTTLRGLLELGAHSCRWPIGDPSQPGFGFCPEHIKTHSVYCEAHHSRAYH